MTLLVAIPALMVGLAFTTPVTDQLNPSSERAGTDAGAAIGASASTAPQTGTSTSTASDPADDGPPLETPAVAPKLPKYRIARTPPLTRKILLPVPRGYEKALPGAFTETSFVVSSFNVLGAGHTAGKKSGRASGTTRIRWALSLLRSHNVSVAGFQEFQSTQVAAFNAASGDYGVWPGASLGQQVHNSVVWRYADWEFVEGRTTAIPYFGGQRIPMPHVLLRNRHSGRLVWFMNYHNPADAHGPAQRWRNTATAIEASLANSLLATGVPVITTGDMNDRAPFICPFTARAPMHSADGAYSSGGQCHVPRAMNVDWIVGSSQFDFSGFVTDRSSLVSRTSDHPMVRAVATLPKVRDADKCVRRKVGKHIGTYCPAP
ncbi:MAG: hypothetical protein R2731_11505 [Nocardioides sp.]